jgi:DNA recombination protein RmuC
MAALVLTAFLAAIIAGTGTWLVLRTRTATLQERLAARDARIAELEARLGEELGEMSRLQAELADFRRQAATLETQLVEERKAASEKLGLLQEAQGQLSDAFKALSAEALKSNNESFLNLARVTLEKFQQGAQSDLEKRQVAIDQLVKPVRETLLKFEGKIGEIEKSRVEAYGSLTEQVRGLGEMQMNLRQETANLVRALGSPRVRGRWGELQLRRVVEIAGMLEHCDFVEQAHVATEDGALRPDLIVRMPGGKSLVIDAKTPMDAYLQALEAPTEPERRAKLAEHARNIRDHMKLLGAKSYWKQFQPAPEFVVLFVPGESFFSAALEHEPELIDRQIDENHVIPASPTTLIALLRAAAYGWRQKALEENAQKISDLGRELFERIITMNEHFGRIGSSLKSAVENYNKSLASFEGRVIVSARRFKPLGIATTKELESVAPVDVTPRLPIEQLPETEEKGNGDSPI